MGVPDEENMRSSVLIIEDDHPISEIISRVLSREGFVTHTAFDGAQGLNAYYLTGPDAIIMDVNMPVMHGGEILTQLLRVPNTPFIMLTV